MEPLRICLVASECTPFAKTGGLADVTAALCRYLAGAGHEVRLFLPLYRRIRDRGVELQPDDHVRDVAVEFAGRTLRFSLQRTALPDSAATVDLVDCGELYDRDQLYTQDGDEDLRFAFLSRAALVACQWRGFAPHVFHVNDWHTALLPLYLRFVHGWDDLFSESRTLLALHNLGYQGAFAAERVRALHLANERRCFHQETLGSGTLNFLETGVLWADRLVTVSETYAREIQSEEHGFGLHDLLRQRHDSLTGIVNGIDVEEWNPATDPHLPFHYDAGDRTGKRQNRDALLQDLGLSPDPAGPVLGVVSRLTSQKGFELLPETMVPVLEQEDVRLAVLGSGEHRYEEWFHWLGTRFPEKVCFWRGYNEALAHRIEASADLFLMPSRYEPCGLNQMYSLRYGTVPLVRATGGLADTVEPYADGGGTGFRFEEFHPDAFHGALRHALEVFRDQDAWRGLVSRGMAQDWSWAKQGAKYVDLYRSMAAGN